MNRLLAPIILLTLTALARSALAEPGYAEREDVHAFIADMSERHGFDAERLRAQFRKARPNPAVIKAITPPADPGSRSWQAYRARFVEPARIARGLDFRTRHAATLARAETRFGVPEDIIVAIIGIETYFGRHRGRFDAFGALTNLAFDYPPRAALFRGELEALLLLARDEGRDPWKYKSSYAGAIGLPQFLPSSIRRWAVDFDDSGRIDLVASVDDAIGSVAHFLAEHGWRDGEPIALPAKVSDGDTPDVQALLPEGIRPARPPAELAARGIATDGAPELPAALIDLPTPGADTEYRLGFNNFYVITRYNRSSFYAAAVMDLAEALRATRP